MSLRHKDVSHASCLAVCEVLNRVGDKWSVLLVSLLGDGPKRFSELRRSIEGISHGMVTRTVYPTVPPRVEYQLTTQGRTLLEPSVALAKWAEQNREKIQAARERFDARSAKARGQAVPQ
jgi:DNA-binding HxlR family transcriptional regulator